MFSVVLCTKKLHFVSQNRRMINCSVACGFSSIKIDYSDNPKRLIGRLNEVLSFFNKISLQPFVLLQSHLLLC